MDNTENNDLKALGSSSILLEAYKDTISPSAKELGKGLVTVAKVVNLALKPISGLVWGYEKIENYVKLSIEEKFKNTSSDKIKSPPPNIAVPLLESLRYTAYQQELRELYINLLTSSMNKDTAYKAHPSFVEIIKQLSPDEAKILKYIMKIKNFPYICHKTETTTHLSTRFIYTGVVNQFEHLCNSIETIEFPELSLSYLDNLKRLSLLEFLQEIGDDTINSSYGENDLIIETERHEYIVVTTLGEQFIDTCIR